MVSERLWINQESIHLFVLFYNNQTTSPKLAPTILLHNGWWIWEQCKTHMWRAIINFTIVGGKWKCYLYVHICIFHDVAHKRSASSAYERNVSENNQDPRAAFLPITMLQNSSKITNLYLENTYIYTHLQISKNAVLLVAKPTMHISSQKYWKSLSGNATHI